MKRWFDFRARAKGAEIVIYDEIGAFGITAKAFLDELKALEPVPEITLRVNSLGGQVFDGVAIYNALKRHDAAITVWIDGIAASIASMIANAGDEGVMPENAMLMLHDPSGLVMGTATDMRGMAEGLDRMKAGMVAAYRDKSGRGDSEIKALMRDESWLSAEEAVDLGLADRVEQPVRMAAHFDLSRFRNTPPRLAALAATPSPQEDAMSDSKKASPRKPGPDESTTPQVTPPETGADADPAPAPAATPQPAVAEAARSAESPPQATAQVIDLDAVRADERKATLAYVSEVHELCNLAGRGDLAAGFVARRRPLPRSAGRCSRPGPPRTRPPPSAAKCGRYRSSPRSLQSTPRPSTPPATGTSAEMRACD